jgi:hypothetical protein
MNLDVLTTHRVRATPAPDTRFRSNEARADQTAQLEGPA